MDLKKGEVTNQRISVRFRDVRNLTLKLCLPLQTDDFMVQSTPDTSPAKWHLAHTTWFFERFILEKYLPNYKKFNRDFDFLFNSYYETVGSYFPKNMRGIISRPTLESLLEYRDYVDQSISELLESRSPKKEVSDLLELGINHEQQHQELLLMDMKMNFFSNPIHPAYHGVLLKEGRSRDTEWIRVEGGLREVGYHGSGFAFDNEKPAHTVMIQPFEIASRRVTNAEFLEFMNDNGYGRPELWLSDGWSFIRSNHIRSPLYWIMENGEWKEFTLSGIIDLKDSFPVCHVSYYEADAFARWAGKKLPTEFQWEVASSLSSAPASGEFMESGTFHPGTEKNGKHIHMLGTLWDWTGSAYLPYPGFRPLPGSVGEYNGKFMSGQMVLRGGSCITPMEHIRTTYRNFYQPEKRWQFCGIRLAGDLFD